MIFKDFQRFSKDFDKELFYIFSDKNLTKNKEFFWQRVLFTFFQIFFYRNLANFSKNNSLIGIAKIPYTRFYFKMKRSFSQNFIEIGGDRNYTEKILEYYSIIINILIKLIIWNIYVNEINNI